MLLELSRWAKWLKEMLVSSPAWDTCLVVCRPQVCEHPPTPNSTRFLSLEMEDLAQGHPRPTKDSPPGAERRDYGSLLGSTQAAVWAAGVRRAQGERGSPGRRGLAQDQPASAQRSEVREG